MQIRNYMQVPFRLIKELEQMGNTDNTSFEAVLYCVEVFPGDFVGVVGDGENGCYEWFYWFGGNLETSNAGYGESTVALRDGLIRCHGKGAE